MVNRSIVIGTGIGIGIGQPFNLLSPNGTMPVFLETKRPCAERLLELGELKQKAMDLDALQAQAKRRGLEQAPTLAAAYDLFSKGVPFALTMLAHNGGNGIYNVLAPDESCGKVEMGLNTVGHCKAPTRGPSKLTLDIAVKLIPEHGDYLVLHIRRTDSLKQKEPCDNSPEKLRLVLNCHLGKYAGHFPYIVLFTDEQDNAYLSPALAILREFALKVVHGDATARAFLGDDDNCLISQVANAARFHPALRRPGMMHLEFGTHRPGAAAHCMKQTQCAANGVPAFPGGRRINATSSERGAPA